MLRSLNLLTILSLLFLAGKAYSSESDDYVVTSGYPVRYLCIAAAGLDPSLKTACMWAKEKGIKYHGFTIYKLTPCTEHKTPEGLVKGYVVPKGMTILSGADVYAPENAFVLAVVVEQPRAGCLSRCFGPKIMSEDQKSAARAAMAHRIWLESRKPGSNIMSRPEPDLSSKKRLKANY